MKFKIIEQIEEPILVENDTEIVTLPRNRIFFKNDEFEKYKALTEKARKELEE